MDTKDTSKIIMIPVKRYDVKLTLDDLLAPLAKNADNLTKTRGNISAEVAPHLQKVSDLASQLHEVITQINRLDPSLLATKPGQVPEEKDSKSHHSLSLKERWAIIKSAFRR
jgi:hypothetical protein